MGKKHTLPPQEIEVIPAVIAERYETCMAVFEDSGQKHIVSSLEMWNALLEIYSRKLWRARFNTAEEWVVYISELGYTGMSRSTVYHKLMQMRSLIDSGVKQELAAAAVTAVPGAIGLLETDGDFQAAVGDRDPNEYIKEVFQLPPGEAIKRVKFDKGNTVEMWIAELKALPRPGELVGVIVRSDGKRGYTSYDLKVTVTPQIPGNQDLIEAVSPWLISRMKGKNDNSRTR